MPWRQAIDVDCRDKQQTETYRNSPNDTLHQVGRFGNEVLGAWIEVDP